MKRPLIGALATVLATATSPHAQAHPTYHYEGGCGVIRVAGGTDGGSGMISLLVVATNTDESPVVRRIEAWCNFRSDFWTWEQTLAHGFGITVAADAGAEVPSAGVLCTVVLISNFERHETCRRFERYSGQVINIEDPT